MKITTKEGRNTDAASTATATLPALPSCAPF
nr:MAG TPA: hypothetical protein [Bacteriophage sp.]